MSMDGRRATRQYLIHSPCTSPSTEVGEVVGAQPGPGLSLSHTHTRESLSTGACWPLVYLCSLAMYVLPVDTVREHFEGYVAVRVVEICSVRAGKVACGSDDGHYPV